MCDIFFRSVKYALAEKYGFRKDYDTTGNYSVYTNEITDLSTLQEEAYLTKYGHYDSYYEEIFGAKRDRYEQLYEYFEDDSKILALTKEEQQFLADFTCLDMGEAGKVATYRDIHTLAEMLKYNMKDSGSGREVIVEGNTIIIRIEGTTDIYTGKEIETHEYRLEFNSEELFGSYYISAGEYANVMGQYSALRIKEGYLGSVQMEELEKQAIRIMESCYTKESLETLSREEYNELLQSCMISADLSGLVYAGYETEHVRMLESVNELKDTFVDKFGMAVLATSVLLSPTAPFAIALMKADAILMMGDGALRFSQGDELEGIVEFLIGAMTFGGTVKAAKKASKVTYNIGSNGGKGSAFARKQLQSILKKEGLSLDEFNRLRLTDLRELTVEQIAKLKRIRDAVPKIDKRTMIQKTIPFEDIEKYIGEDGYSTIRGYISRYDDVSHISGYENVVESSRLDYTTSSGVRPYPEGGNAYGYIKFKTNDVDQIGIPYGKAFGGTNTDSAPCTLNGFTGARNGEIIPEWIVNGSLEPIEGAELHEVIGTKDSIVAVFDGEHFREVNR